MSEQCHRLANHDVYFRVQWIRSEAQLAGEAILKQVVLKNSIRAQSIKEEKVKRCKKNCYIIWPIYLTQPKEMMKWQNDTEVEIYTSNQNRVSHPMYTKVRSEHVPCHQREEGKEVYSDLKGREFDNNRTVRKPHDCIRVLG